MTSLLDTPPLGLLDSLRGDPSRRPARDLATAPGLRAHLEDELFALWGDVVADAPLVIRASSLRSTYNGEVAPPLAQARGVLVNQALRLLCVGADLERPFESALNAWRCEVGSNDLVDFVDGLDADERARLASAVDAHARTLSGVFGPVGGRWLPRTGVRASQRLAGGNLVLRDVVDLMVGSTATPHASVVLLDVTTAPLDENIERVTRFHALVQTLRTSTTPLRTSAFSTATGELWSRDVDAALLHRGLEELLDVVRAAGVRP
ncbi:MAG: hypothetical protein KGJ10_04960 [Acidobacteriota bacterium]|nr:hypothetical protein [Acidobacteriota bacterium]MDE3106587.1 hypothetical protein [Acidobacteriota bacterium]